MNQELDRLLMDLVDEDECSLDHNGNCQAHGWMGRHTVCPQKRLKDILERELKMIASVIDWEKVESHLNDVVLAYNELIGKTNVNPLFGLAVIHHLKQRFNAGERTNELYKEIMDLE